MTASTLKADCNGDDDGDSDGDDDGDGVVDSQERHKLWAKLCADRRQKQEFSHCASVGVGVGDKRVFGQSGNATAWFAKTKAAKFTGKPGEKHRLCVLSADLFSLNQLRANPTAPGTRIEKSAEWPDAVAWVLGQQTDVDFVAVFDGRQRSHRREAEDKFDALLKDENKKADLLLTYEVTYSQRDYRFPARKVAFSSNANEHGFVALPLSKVRFSSKPRSEYTAGVASATTTHSLDYHKVIFRSMGEIPFLAKEDKEKLVGGRAFVLGRV